MQTTAQSNAQLIVQEMFEGADGPMKKVRVCLVAMKRVEWSTTVEVPFCVTEDQTDAMLRRIYDDVDGDDYEDDPDYWEESEHRLEDVRD